VANIVVYIELVDGRPAGASLQALGEGRRMATFLGATLYAVLACAEAPRYGHDDAVAILSRHGADKIVLSGGPAPTEPSLFITHGAALSAALERIPPTLLLIAATPGGRDLAPRLAARLGAAYVPEPSVEYGPRGDLVLSRLVYGGTFRRRLAAEDVERPIVATCTPGSYPVAAGSDEAEVIVVEGGAEPDGGAPQEVARRDDPGAVLETARVVVTAGAGVTPEAYPLVRELAHALGGEVAVTRAAVAKGLDVVDREVGVGGRRVAPRLYFACGASGSPAHLGAVSADTPIVAINRDADAPIFRVAAYGIVGDIAEVVGSLLVALRRSQAVAG
jgi:electron transfer flavoprotein alpha subunit